MHDRQHERGEGRASFIVTLAVMIVGIFVAIKVIPVRIDAYEFREVLRDEARQAVVIKDDRELARRILEAAHEMELPLERENLSIKRSSREIVIKATYEKPIDLTLTTYTYRFDGESRSPLF